MKKHVKLITLLLTVALLMQIAPLGAIGEDAVAGTYNVDASVVTESTEVTETTETVDPVESEAEVIESQPAESETEAEAVESQPAETEALEPETEIIESQPAESEAEAVESETAQVEAVDENLSIYYIQWQTDTSVDVFYTLASSVLIESNVFRFRALMIDTPDEIAIAMDGAPILDYTVSGSYIYMDIEAINGYHELIVTLTKDGDPHSFSFTFSVAGSAEYPEVFVSDPESVTPGSNAEFLLKAENFDNVSRVAAVLKLNDGVKVSDVILADGVSGMFFWFRGELNLVVDILDASLITDGCLARIQVEIPEDFSANIEYSWVIADSDVLLKDSATIGGSTNFISKVTIENPGHFITTTYRISHRSSYLDPGFSLFTIINDAHAAAVGVHLYNADNNEYIGTSSQSGIVKTDYFAPGGTYRVYCRDERGVSSEVYEFTFKALN